MAGVTLTAPDGRQFTLTPPEGTPPEEVQAQAARLAHSMAGDMSAVASATGAAPTGSSVEPGASTTTTTTTTGATTPSAAPSSGSGGASEATGVSPTGSVTPQGDTLTATPFFQQAPAKWLPTYGDMAANVAGAAAASAAPELALGSATADAVAGSSLGLHVLKGAARAILSGIAGTAAMQGVGAATGTLDPRKQGDLTYMAGQFLANALPQIGAEFLGPMSFRADEALKAQSLLETPASRLAKAQAAEREANQSLAAGHASAAAQGISEAATHAVETGQTNVAGQAGPFVTPQTLPSMVSPQAASPYRTGFELQDLGRSEVLPKVTARKNALYARAAKMGDATGETTSAAPFVDRAQAVLDDITERQQQLGRPVDTKLRARVNDILNAGQTEAVPGVPLYTSSEATRPTQVGARAPEPRTLAYSDLDALRRELQPYVTAYSKRSAARTQQQGTIDSFMGDIRDAMGQMESAHPELARQADMADNYYIHHFKPVADVVGVESAGAQPSTLATMLLSDGAPDRLFKAVQAFPESTAMKVRAEGWSQLAQRATDPITGNFDSAAYLKSIRELQPRQLAALSGGASRTLVNDVLDSIAETAPRQAQLRAGRVITDSRMQALARNVDTAMSRVDALQSTVNTQAANQSRQGIEGAVRTATGLGMGAAGVAGILLGHPAEGLAGLLTGGYASRQAFAKMLSSPSALKFMAKAVRAPNQTMAIKMGTAALLSTANDLIQGKLDAEQPPQ